MKKTVAVLVGILSAGAALADNAPLQLSLTPDVALLDRDDTVEGLTVGLWSENPQSALALGLVNGSTGRSAGLSLALLLNYADDYKGLQWAPVNYTQGEFLGWQLGLVNYTGGLMTGLQSGVVNYADRLTGLQFGLVNYAHSADTGVQIGLVNLMPANAWFSELPDELAPAMVLVNWSL